MSMIQQTNIPIAALFDLDGVIIDTESQYTNFWTEIMQKYAGDGTLAQKLKGATLEHIYEKWFAGKTDKQKEITMALDKFEKSMKMEYIPGLIKFVQNLKSHSVHCAIVTSSNNNKMKSVLINCPELKTLFDKILTAEMFAKSKPAPDPYLLGSTLFNIPTEQCYVFEDSFNGLAAGRAAHMHVIGLATTNSLESIKNYADFIISDFTEMTYEKLITK